MCQKLERIADLKLQNLLSKNDFGNCDLVHTDLLSPLFYTRNLSYKFFLESQLMLNIDFVKSANYKLFLTEAFKAGVLGGSRSRNLLVPVSFLTVAVSCACTAAEP